jgi:hypothetical protein
VLLRTVVVGGCAAVIALNSLSSVASEAFGFSYTALWPISLVVYGAIAFVAARLVARVGAGVVAGLSVAATEATLGWAISWLIGPGQPAPEDQAAGAVVAVALTVTVSGAVIGLVAGLLGKRAAARALLTD